MQIEGVSHATILSIISEIGPEGFQKFDTSKHFTSWLRLAPNNKKTGGKIISNKVPKGSNRLKIALRNAANAIGNLKDTQYLFLDQKRKMGLIKKMKKQIHKFEISGEDLGMKALIFNA